MIVEHTFVTTRSQPDALAAAGQMLALLNFKPATDPAPASREWFRGKGTPRRTFFVSDLPQRVRIDFDRGRVNVAGSVQLRHKKQLEARDTMVAVTVALEQLLAHNQPLDTASADVRAKQAWIARMDFRRKICMFILLMTPVALAAAVAVAANLHKAKF